MSTSVLLDGRVDDAPPRPARRSVGRGEIRALTGMRIVAALWVVLTHYQQGLVESFGHSVDLLIPVMQTGWLGVDLFFLLSGFVLTLNYVERMGPQFDVRASLTFLWARLARIWPLYAVLSTIMFGWMVASGWRFPWAAEDRPVMSLLGFVEQLGLVQMWHRMYVPPSTYLAPGWSLSVELLAYVSFPIVVLVLWRLRNASPMVLGVLAVTVMTPLALYGSVAGLSTYHLPWPARIAGAFLSGGLTCLFVRQVRESAAAEKWAPVVAVAAIVELLMVVYWTGARLQAGGIDRSVMAVVLFPVLVGALALSDRGPAAVLSREIFVLGGRISFALYLVHFLVLEVVLWLEAHLVVLAPGSALRTLLDAQMIVGSLIASYLLWRFVEEPGRRFMLRHGPVRTAGGRVAAVPVADRSPAPRAVQELALVSATAETMRLSVGGRDLRSASLRPVVPPPHPRSGGAHSAVATPNGDSRPPIPGTTGRASRRHDGVDPLTRV